jgi:exodeoxyribonuclease V alpha subunit
MTEAATSGGHTYLPRPMLISRAVQMLRVDESLVETQVTQALLTKMLVSFRLPGQEEDGLCLPVYFTAESAIAMRLAYLMEARPFKKVEGFSKRMAAMVKELGIRLSTMQRKAVRSAVEEGRLIITGGPPARAKTHSSAVSIRLLKDDKRHSFVRAHRPRRQALTEATVEEATTIHRMLELRRRGDVFSRDENSPLET